MRVLFDHAKPLQRAPTLALLLPGALQQPEDLRAAGLADDVRNRGLPLDLAFGDPGMQSIAQAADGSLLAGVHARLQAARDDGYATIWLGGISIGAFLALAYAATHQQVASSMIDGLCLLSPYPGNRLLQADIRRAGGLPNWRAACADGDDECRVWRWLQAHGKAGALPIYCGYGRQDRFAGGQLMLAQALPPSQVDVIDGPHDWPAWRKLWNNFLDRAFAAGAPAAQPEQR